MTSTPKQLPGIARGDLTAKAVYESLSILAGDSDTAETKLHTIAEQLGIHYTTVMRAVRRLRGAGVIDYHAKRGRITSYQLRGLFLRH